MEKQNSKFRWVVFFAVTFTYLVMSSQRTAPGLITDQIMIDFSVPAATIGLLTSMQYFVYTGLQIPMGILSDRYGPDFFLISGALLTGVGTIMYSLASHESILFISRMLTGIGDATIWVNMVIILGRWFHVNEFTRLIGIAGMSGSLGFLLATVPFSLLISLLGWRPSFFLTGILLCLCSLLLYYVLIKKPEQLFTTTEKEEKKDVQQEKTWVLLRRVFSQKQAWALFFCHFGIVGSYVGFISSWAVPYGMNLYELSRSSASAIILVGVIGAILGAPFISWVSSRFNTIKRPYIVVHCVALIGWLIFYLFNGQPPFYFVLVLFFFIGFAYGASALTFALVRNIFSLKDAGFVSGIANTGGFLSAVLLPSIFGFILNHYQLITGDISAGFHYAFLTPIVFSIIGLIGISSVKEKKKVVEAG